MKQLTRDEIKALYEAGGFLGLSAPFGDWWMYPPEFEPVGSPKWSSGTMARRVDPELPREMEKAEELKILYGDRFAKVWIMQLAETVKTEGT